MLEKKLKFKLRSVINGIIYLFCSLLSILPSYCIQGLIDEGLINENISLLIVYAILLILAPFLSIFLSVLISYKNILFARKKSMTISMEIYDRIISQDIEYFDDKDSNELASLCSREISSYIYFVISERPRLVALIISSLTTLVMISLHFWIIAIILLLYIPLSFLPEKYFSKKIEPEIQNTISNNAKLQQKKAESFKNIEYIKTNNIYKDRWEEIESISNKGLFHWVKISIYDSLSSFWNSAFLPSIFTAISLALGILFYFVHIPGQYVTIGAFSSLFPYTILFCNQINSIAGLDYSNKKHKTELFKINEFLSLSDYSSENKVQYKALEKGIAFKNVSFAYKDKEKVLNELSLEIKAYRWTCIVGPSGIGKSTLLSLIVGMRKAKSGQIIFDDSDINDINMDSLRKNIAYISQNSYFFSGSIKYNFSFFIKNEDEIFDALKRFNLYDLVFSLPNGINTDIGEAAKLMSGGEKQRLSLAIQYARKCQIWLLDEICAHLDKDNKELILNKLKNMVHDDKITIIMVSHDDEEIKYADDIIHL